MKSQFFAPSGAGRRLHHGITKSPSARSSSVSSVSSSMPRALQRPNPSPRGRRPGDPSPSTEGQRIGSARSLSRHRKCGRRGSCYYTGREWLLDNYHLVEGQIAKFATICTGYYRQLPKLTTDFRRLSAGLRRGLGLCRSYGQPLRPEMLRRFVRAYQRVQAVTIGELWAVAITLRIVLVENLRRGAKRIVTGRGRAPEATLPTGSGA